MVRNVVLVPACACLCLRVRARANCALMFLRVPACNCACAGYCDLHYAYVIALSEHSAAKQRVYFCQN
jgi:hypothetical protein